MAFFFIRVDTANEAVYELVAEPVQEPQAEDNRRKPLSTLPWKLLIPLTYKASPGA